jgi:hypothetical protein
MLRITLAVSVCSIILALPASSSASAQQAAAPAPGAAASTPAKQPSFPSALSGKWRATPDELPLTSEFDKSVWGENARQIRTIEMELKGSGEGTLTVAERVVDAKGRTVPGSEAIDETQFVVGGVVPSYGTRTDYGTTISKAERRFPGTPAGPLSLDGLQVRVVPFDGETDRVEIRYEPPGGDGSFWATLTRAGQTSTRRGTF